MEKGTSTKKISASDRPVAKPGHTFLMMIDVERLSSLSYHPWLVVALDAVKKTG